MKLEDLCLTSQQTILPPVRQASDSLFQTTLLFSRLTMLGRRSNNPSVQEVCREKKSSFLTSFHRPQ